MIKHIIESLGYYLRCMSLFNAIYLICLLKENDLSLTTTKACLFEGTILLMVILGVVFTYLIAHSNDEVQSSATLGKSVELEQVDDCTGSNYFGNFSLIVLTGLSMPTKIGAYAVLIYLIVFVSLGIVYIKKSLFYMNPLLTLLDYSVYKCRLKNYNGEFVFVVKGRVLTKGDVLHYRNTNNRIIRLGH